MVPQELITIFDDCANRLAEGTTIEECLRLYPAYAAALRPLLQAQMQVARITIPPPELYAAQTLVWERIEQALPAPLTLSGARSTRRLLSLLAASIMLLLVGGGWFALTRLVEPTATPTMVFAATDTDPPTMTPTMTPSPTASPMLTATPSPELSLTTMWTATSTTTVTKTPLASATPTLRIPTRANTATPDLTPTMTFAPGCGAPLTSDQAGNVVLQIFPNAVITKIEQLVRPDGRLVWVIDTTQNIKVTVDVACGSVLTIDRPGTGDNENNNTNANANDNGSGGEQNDNGNDNNNNDNENDNESGSGDSGMD